MKIKMPRKVEKFKTFLAKIHCDNKMNILPKMNFLLQMDLIEFQIKIYMTSKEQLTNLYTEMKEEG